MRCRTVEKKLWASGRGTNNPAAPEFKAGARIVYLGQEGDDMILGYVVAVHGDGKGGPPFYTAYIEGVGGDRLKDINCFMWLLKMITPPPCVHPGPIPVFFQGLSSQKRQKGEERVSQADVRDGQNSSAAASGKQET
jgi:hypothetical protein